MIEVAVQRSVPQARVGLSGETQRRLLVAGLLLGDGLFLAVAFVVAYAVRFHLGLPLFREVEPSQAFYLRSFIVLIPVWLAMFTLFHLYDEQYLLGGTREYTQLFYACSVAMVSIMAFVFFDHSFVLARGWLLVAWMCAFLIVAGWRFSVRRLVYRLRRRGYFLSPVLIVGANEEGQALAEQLCHWPTSGLHVIGFVDDGRPVGSDVARGRRVLGRVADLQRLIGEHGIRELVVATTALRRPALLEVFRSYGTSDLVRLRMSSGLFEIMTTGVQVAEIGHVSLFSVNKVRLTGLDTVLKTALDYAVIMPGLIAVSPLMLLVALVVKLDSPGPVIYRRRVLGVGNRPFDALKFRTMHVNGDEILQGNPDALAELHNNHKCQGDPRVTRVGGFLRKTSLDELPQLVNVLMRQMSLVGPRMISPPELEKYGKWGMNLLTIPPGITGLWQISGRSDLSYEQRVQLDMSYIRNYTLWLDLEILLRTIPAVLRGHGAY
jgi:exopolysaccharide biosynthesis polyprenyl glycosylphosphotransferase